MAGYTHTCARCGTEMSVHERYLGRTLKCTGCRLEFVADPSGAAAAPAGDSLPETSLHTCTACGAEMTVARRYVGRTLRCTACGEEFTARIPFTAGSPTPPLDEDMDASEPPSAPDPEARRRLHRAVAAGVVLVAVLAAALWYLGGDRDEGIGGVLFRSEKTRMRTEELRFGDAPYVAVALDRDGVNRLIDVAAAKEQSVPDEVVQSAGYVSVRSGTRVRVLETRRHAEARVRILDGPQNSRVVWVPAAWIR